MSDDPDLDEFEELTEVEALRAQLARKESELRRAKAKTEDLIRAARRGAREAAMLLGNPPVVRAPTKDKRKSKPELGVLHLSDWQIGKVTQSYNSDMAVDRVDRLASKVWELTEIERADHPVRELHVLLGGDLVEGASIFPGQVYEIDSGLFRQVFVTIGALERLTRTMLTTFDVVHLWSVYGNHGRLGKKGEQARDDNADVFVYDEVRARLAEYEASGRLLWHERDGWYSLVEAGAYRALLVHGDQIKQFGGNIPAFGIYRKVNGWASGVLPAFTDCYMGHFHQPLVIPMANGRGRTFVNASLESDSVYAQEFVAATGTPGQRLNFVEPAAGRVTTERLIWLDA